jgi:uncharacterized repeat protein (TIGR03803 family)
VRRFGGRILNEEGRLIVINKLKELFSNLRLEAASAVLMFAVLLVLEAMTEPAAHAQTFSTLYNFTGAADGGVPMAGVVKDARGNIYGTTNSGGSAGNGVVFAVNTGGVETVLYDFADWPNGANPNSTPFRDKAKKLYGTTYYGGGNFGVVFSVDTNGNESVLHTFEGFPDGAFPDGGLIQDKDGNLYGTTSAGGDPNCDNGNGCGTVFKLSKNGTLTVLHTFEGGPNDGDSPALTTLLINKQGNIYGTTTSGGRFTHYGVVYKLAKNGKLTVLHSFAGGTADGCHPFGTPASDDAGNLYGTTLGCGSFSDGTVWEVNKKGVETIMHNFSGSRSDGNGPFAGVVRDSKGNLYGDTFAGGSSSTCTGGCGTVYRLSQSGVFTLLHSFALSDGAYPSGDLLRDAKGRLYGTTSYGGSSTYYGTVWSYK